MKKRIFLLVILVAFFVLYFKANQPKIFSIAFGDEEENFIIGKWFLSGKRLYEDIFFQHQPSLPIVSSLIQKIVKPNSIFLLVKRHREAVLFYSALCFLFLTWHFGLPVFFFAIFYTLSNFVLLGNLFLAESVVVPPILFVSGIIYSLVRDKKKVLNNFELILTVGCLIFIQLTLLPMAPFVVFASIFLWRYLSKGQKKGLIYFFSLALVFIIVFWQKLSISYYFEETFLINFVEFVPGEISRQPLAIFLLRIFFMPIFVFSNPSFQGFYLILKVISFLYLLSIFFLLRKKKLFLGFISYFLICLVNFRAQPLGLFYSGFHLLPCYGILFWMMLLNMATLLSLRFCLLITFLAVFILPFGLKELSRKNDQYNDWYVNYSSSFDFGEAVRLLSKEKDTLLTIPEFPLIYWQSGLFSNSPYFFAHPFIYKSPKLSKEILSHWQENPPDFVYFHEMADAQTFFGELLDDYSQVKRDGKLSRLWVHKEKLSEISGEEWQQVARYAFSKP